MLKKRSEREKSKIQVMRKPFKNYKQYKAAISIPQTIRLFNSRTLGKLPI